MPIGILLMDCSTSLGGYLENKLSVRAYIYNSYRVVLLGLVVKCSGYVILYFSYSLIIDLIALGVIGFGTGLNVHIIIKSKYMPPIR